MRFDSFSFGSIRIDGVTCNHDVVIDFVDSDTYNAVAEGDFGQPCQEAEAGQHAFHSRNHGASASRYPMRRAESPLVVAANFPQEDF